VPDVRQAAHAQAAVKAAKYPPLASAALPPPCRTSSPQPPGETVLPRVDAATMVIVQFESAEAIDNAEAISPSRASTWRCSAQRPHRRLGDSGRLRNPKVRDAYSARSPWTKKHGKHVGVRRARFAPEADGRARQNGRALRVDGHGSRFLLSAATEQAKQVRAVGEFDFSGHSGARA